MDVPSPGAPIPCGETIILDQTVPVSKVKLENPDHSPCLLYFKSPSDTKITIEFRVFRLASYDGLCIYDSTGSLLLSIFADGDYKDLSLNPVISDSYARMELYTYNSSPDALVSLDVRFTGKSRQNKHVNFS